MKTHILILLFGILPLSEVVSQAFKYHSTAPYGIQMVAADSSKGAFKYMFADFDQDEDLDLVLMGIDSIIDSLGFNYKGITYFVAYQENIGDKKHPAFADRVALSDNFPFVEGLFFPAIGDLDHDGHPDLVVCAEIDDIGAQHILYYHRLANGTFEVQRMDILGLDPLLSQSVFQPELTDLDHDGDLDLLMTGYAPEFFDTTGTTSVPEFRYAKNIGDAYAPLFLGWFKNPYGLSTDPVPTMSVSGDINLDGDVDLLTISVIDSITPFYFYENVPGSNGKPFYKAPRESPFGLPQPEANVNYIAPTLVDLDGDSDLDLFVYRFDTTNTGGLMYFENTLSPSGTSELNYTNDAIMVVPNPAKEEWIIKNATPLEILEVSIYSQSGKIIRVVRENLGEPIDIRTLPNGIYFLRLRLSNHHEIIRKMVVMKE